MNCLQSALPVALHSRLPQVDAATLTLQNRLLRRRQLWQGKTLQVSVDARTSMAPACSLPARLGSAAMLMELDAELLAQLLAASDLQRDFQALPDPLQSLLLEQALLPWIEPLEQLLGQPLSLDATPQACPLSLFLQLQRGDQKLGVMRLWLSPLAAEQVAGLLEQHLRPAGDAMAELPLRLTLQRGWQQLSLAELRSLQPGDMLMLDCPANADGVLVLADGAGQARCKRSAKGLQLLETFRTINRTTENPMGQEADEAQLDDVPLTVVCQVGSLELPLGQLRELGEGSVLALPDSQADAVQLMVNGRCVGRGELVAIGEGLGVRLTRFAGL